MMKSCTAQFGQTIPCMVSTLTLGIFVELNKKMCLKICFILKTRTANVVRNAGCACSRYTLNFLKSINELMN